MTDTFRCAGCEAILADPSATRCGSCDSRHDDVVMLPNGDLWQARWNRYGKRFEWTQLVPLGHESDDFPDHRAVLVCRTVEGKRLPVVPLGDGEMYAVRAVS